MTRAVQRRFGSGECALIEQDLFRRTVLRDGDVDGALNIELIEQASLTCLKRGLVVIIEGILNAKRYGAMLERLSSAYPAASLFYAYDLSFEETAIRHVTREKSVSFGTDDMKEWYHGWQPLGFIPEVRIDSSWTESATVEQISSDIAAARMRGR